MKLTLITISIYFLIKYACADCPNGILYCFDSQDKLLGQITVGRCWTWTRLSCVPCAADTSSRKITFNEYISYCKHYYSNSVQVLNTDSVWGDNMYDAWNRLGLG